MRLAELIADPDAGIGDIAVLLDSLEAPQRWAHLRDLDRTRQRSLYRKAAGNAMDLAYLVSDAGPRVEVIHDGLNTLPMPPRLRRFQKRFCRPDGGPPQRLFGYNEGPTRRLLGPGYFVATLMDERSPWQERGSIMVDYYQVPDSPVAGGWPSVGPNSAGLQRFVYHETRDFLRRVSAHVSVGAAYRRDEPMDHYFILCRRT
jgi:hypothetical protein